MRRNVFAPLLAIALTFILTLTGCTIAPVKAEDRIFLDLSLDFLGEYRLSKQEFANTTVGGLSGITYDRQRDRLYAISDDRSDRNPARFYTLTLTIAPERKIKAIEVEKVTTLLNADGQPFAKGTLDPEGIALTPRNSVFISSEGVSKDGINPFINEFNLETGQQLAALPIPQRFLPTPDSGIQDNQGFESLTLSAVGFGTGQQLEPFRLFSATESALLQDAPSDNPKDPSAPVRFLHYLIGETNPMLLSENIYLLDPPPEGTQNHGLTEMLVLDQAGHFLSLERSFGVAGFGIRLFQAATGGANDTSGVEAFRGNIGNITPIRKELLLNLADLGIPLDNLEGMTLGPRLPDGTQSLLLVSDDNFSDMQVTQFLLFRLRGFTAQ
jgi:hypothetical protein